MTEFEKGYLKEAICGMLDEGRTYGRVDTIEMKENPQHRGLSYYDFNHKVWEISIRVIRTNEYGEL